MQTALDEEAGMQVTVLYSEDCPNWRTAEARLREALDRLGRHDAIVTPRQVGADEQGQALSFRGSPTILVDGRDPFAGAGAPADRSCRLYRSAEGLSGAPTIDQLLEALG